MRVMIMCDLPTLTHTDLRNYRKFNKFLVSDGFIMMQESIYTKLATNTTSANLIIDKIKKNIPPKGLIQLLTITEKQYSQIELISGELKTKYIQDTERLLRI